MNNQENPKTPHDRLEAAVQVIDNPVSRLIIRRIYKNEMAGASIFWDEKEKSIEFINDNFSITIQENK